VAGVDERARLGRANALYGFVRQDIEARPCACFEIEANDESKHVFPLVITVTPCGAQPIALREETQQVECDPALRMRVAQGSLRGLSGHHLKLVSGSDDLRGRLWLWEMGRLFS
jgi:hypothetical protein